MPLTTPEYSACWPEPGLDCAFQTKLASDANLAVEPSENKRDGRYWPAGAVRTRESRLLRRRLTRRGWFAWAHSAYPIVTVRTAVYWATTEIHTPVELDALPTFSTTGTYPPVAIPDGTRIFTCIRPATLPGTPPAY